MPKKGDRAAPPPPQGGWDVVFGDKDAPEGWNELCRTAATSMRAAYEALTQYPTSPQRPKRQHRLKGQLSTRMVNGRDLEQWQYEVTCSGRIWYCPDPEKRVIWVMYASPQHP